MNEFKAFTQKHRAILEEVMCQEVQDRTEVATLCESMLYSLKAGGKRFRPMLFLATCESIGVRLSKKHYQLAAALEMVHTYSLIHDDLPAMDNDDLRRGIPTNHVVFGEAMAILAGDGLLSLAFELTAEVSENAQIVVLLAKCCGVGENGMVAGQVLDIEGEGKTLPLAELQNIHAKKTGGLIRYAIEAALLSAHKKSECLVEFAKFLGISFQIRDDILDITQSTEELGKTAGKDIKMAKSTYPQLLGLEGAKKALGESLIKAENCLSQAEKEFPEGNFTTLYSLLKEF
ncbi:geranylgeranyl diphosphate synthase, type II [Pilibacter termitis]|uniref:Farnesyl diphosphate synthase n=1 Tax=Pilibacter termitis TaxID=263852 RepID=A0A1T4NRU6_9ENTE|nr:farnesyl diphosphate synthase [Pilibacter termitis]SJZ81902.1 geranylgeranyl diphosphate synthase, type II [Pilibacter termitis]